MNRSYEDIINLPHHVSSKHPRMSKEARAAQFSPFAALTGFSDEINETARITDDFRDMSEDYKASLDRKIIELQNSPKQVISVNYFLPDAEKTGGSYREYIGELKTVDYINKVLIFTDGKKIEIEYIFNISKNKSE